MKQRSLPLSPREPGYLELDRYMRRVKGDAG
jgi:hypothetical protein